MGRPRRSGKDSPIDTKQKVLTERAEELRRQMQELQQLIADAPRVAEEMTRQQREEFLARASEGHSRLDVAVDLQDKRYGDDGGGSRRRGAMRKERREGRIIFIVLIIALAAAIIWLVSHLQHF